MSFRPSVPRWVSDDPSTSITLIVAAIVFGVSLLPDVGEGLSRSMVLGVLTAVAWQLHAESKKRREFQDSIRSELIESRELAVVPAGPEIRRVFGSALKEADRWVYWGGTGSYLRGVTIPNLLDQSRRAGAVVPIKITLLDPLDQENLSNYAQYRKKLKTYEEKNHSAKAIADRTAEECWATILALSWYAQHRNGDLRLSLLDNYSVLRLDITQKIAIATNEDPNFPALAAASSGHTYGAFLAEADRAFSLGREVRLVGEGVPVLPEKRDAIKVTACRQVIQHVSRDIPPESKSNIEFTDEQLTYIVERAFERKDPYG